MILPLGNLDSSKAQYTNCHREEVPEALLQDRLLPSIGIKAVSNKEYNDQSCYVLDTYN